jgi:hypothetical protein
MLIGLLQGLAYSPTVNLTCHVSLLGPTPSLELLLHSGMLYTVLETQVDRYPLQRHHADYSHSRRDYV